MSIQSMIVALPTGLLSRTVAAHGLLTHGLYIIAPALVQCNV